MTTADHLADVGCLGRNEGGEVPWRKPALPVRRASKAGFLRQRRIEQPSGHANLVRLIKNGRSAADLVLPRANEVEYVSLRGHTGGRRPLATECDIHDDRGRSMDVTSLPAEHEMGRTPLPVPGLTREERRRSHLLRFQLLADSVGEDQQSQPMLMIPFRKTYTSAKSSSAPERLHGTTRSLASWTAEH
jgi:hypothetical protein